MPGFVTISIGYREKPIPGFQSVFPFIQTFDIRPEDKIKFIKIQFALLQIFYRFGDFEEKVIDVWAEIFDGEEFQKISWEDSDISDFSEFVKSIK